MIDLHTHTSFSPDADVPMEEMALVAIDKGVNYIAFTDHFDMDYYYSPSLREDHPILDFRAQNAEANRLQRKYSDKITIGCGLELGYAAEAVNEYNATTSSLKLDVIINSIHCIDGEDAYYPRFFEGKSKKDVYNRYLEVVYESVTSNLDYDIIGHIGYIQRHAPYEDKQLFYDFNPQLIDKILLAIIARGKTMEVNSNQPLFMPEKSICQRYFELGGRDITFSSDAHVTGRICDKFDKVVKMLQSIGFDRLTYYVGRVKSYYKM